MPRKCQENAKKKIRKCQEFYQKNGKTVLRCVKGYVRQILVEGCLNFSGTAQQWHFISRNLGDKD